MSENGLGFPFEDIETLVRRTTKSVFGLETGPKLSDRPELGDLSIPAFVLAKHKSKPPAEIASKLAEQLRGSALLEEVSTAGPFVNLKVSLSHLAKKLVNALENGFPHENALAGQAIVVEHTSSNPNGPVHIGNFRGSVIGDVFARINKHLGAMVNVRYLVNDLGQQMAPTAIGLQLLEDAGVETQSPPDLFVGKIYGSMNNLRMLETAWFKYSTERSELPENLFHPEALESERANLGESVQTELSELFSVQNSLRTKTDGLYDKLRDALEQKWGDGFSLVNGSDQLLKEYMAPEGDKEQHPIHKVVTLALNGHKNMLGGLNIHHDAYDCESTFEWNGDVKKLVEELSSRGFAGPSEGAVVFFSEKAMNELEYSSSFEKIEHEVCNGVLYNSRGISLYMARDLAYSHHKFKSWSSPGKAIADKVFNVIGKPQYLPQLHLRIALAALGEEDMARNQVHFDYEFVHFKDRKMSGRLLEYVTPTDVLLATKNAVDAIIRDSVELTGEQKEGIKQAIAVAAVKFAILRQATRKQVTYSVAQATDMNASSAPFVLYALTRAKGILRKQKVDVDFSCEHWTQLCHPRERTLLLNMSQFPQTMTQAVQNRRPDLIANYSYELAQNFNKFYDACRISGEPNTELASARLELVRAFAKLMGIVLDLMGMDELERM